MTSGVELRGATSLEDGLAAFADHLLEWDALRTVAEDWRDRGQRRAPRLTGRLAASLDVRRAEGGYEVHSSLPYARVIHNGWSAHNIRANPFLADTVDPAGAATTLADDLGDQLAHIHGA